MTACERCNDPNHGSRFKVVRKPDAADIDGVPVEVLTNARDLFFCFCIVSAEKHVRRPTRELGLAKMRVPHGVEGLDDERSRQSLLIEFAPGTAKTANQLGKAIRHIQWIRGVDYDLSLDTSSFGHLDRFYGLGPVHCDNNQFSEFRR